MKSVATHPKTDASKRRRLQASREPSEPLTRKIYTSLRGKILSGALPAGTRIASTRRAAVELGVSRNTVMAVYRMLLREGFLEGRFGKGTYVAQGVSLSPQTTAGPAPLPSFEYMPYRFEAIDFRAGIPDLDRFPIEAWKRLSREVWSKVTPLDLTYSRPEGRIELRRQIALHLQKTRGESCNPDRIVVTTGATQAIGLVSSLLLRGKWNVCLLEDPSPSEIRRIVADAGGLIHPVPVDENGLVTDLLPTDDPPAFIMVSPHHQQPLGVTMPLPRKIQLLGYARRTGAFIVEYDTDGDLSYDSPPPASLQGMDPSRVIHVGSFSATLFPSLRMGFIVLPPDLIGTGREMKWFSDLHTAAVDQLVLARFMETGSYARHLKRMRRTYPHARARLVEALARHFGTEVKVLGRAAGLHLCARFTGIRFTAKILNRISLAGVGVYPVEEHAIAKGRWADTLILGYGTLDTRSINVGIAILKRCVPSG